MPAALSKPLMPMTIAAPSWRVARWAVLVALIGIGQQAWLSLDCDVSWLITTAERMIDGATLYRDVEEVNPPASILIYMPFVFLARLLTLPVEPVVVTGTTILAGLSIAHAGRLLAPPMHARAALAAAATYVLLVLPAFIFAQREHFALIAGLPMFALLIARIEGRRVGQIDAWKAGLGAGILIIIKPHLVLALLPIAAWAIVRRRAIGVEWISAAMLCAAYALVVILGFPLYLDRMLPLLRLTYLPWRDSWISLLGDIMVVVPAVATMLTFWLARGRPSRSAIAALLVAGGFLAAALAQGKGYLNHGYPAVAMALMAVALELARPGEARRFGAACVTILALCCTQFYSRVPEPHALRDAVVRIGPPNPALIGISYDFALGHPLTRWVDGRWVGRRGSLWVTGTAAQQLADPQLPPDRRAALQKATREEAAMLAADIRRGRPDIVLVDANPGRAWIAAHPAVAAAMADYRPAAAVDKVTLWIRR